MSTEIREFATNNKLGALMVPASLGRLAYNGEHYAPGRFRKRPGLTTAVTINLTVGSAAPFRMETWVAGATYRIAVGADACVFTNPFNGMLYYRTSGGAGILADISTPYGAWGLSAPSGGVTNVTPFPPTSGATSSSHASGYYAYAVRKRDPLTLTVSKPVFLTATKVAGSDTDKLQKVSGPLQSVLIPNLGAVDLFRTRMLTFKNIRDWTPAPTSDFAHLRMIDAITGAITDSGGQADGPLLDFCDDIPPFCAAAAFFDGCWLYGSGYKIYVSNPACPSNYAGNSKSVLMEGVNGELLHALGEILIPTRAGTITGFAVMGDSCLVLCQHGAWPIIRGNQPGLYGVSHDCLYVGCVSQATIAYSPAGVWWLATEGIALWTGAGAPEVITEHHIDPLHADTLFRADLSTACGAYDVPRKTYFCVVPKSTTGQFILAVRGDRLPNQIMISKWEQLTGLGDIIGMGYDWYARRVVFLFTPGAIVGRALTAGTYSDKVGDAAGTYAFGPVFLWGANERVRAGAPLVKRSIGMILTVLREDVSTIQTVVTKVRGIYGPDDSIGTDVTLSPAAIWPIDSYKPVNAGSTLAAGRLFRISLMETSTKPFEFSSVAIGSADEMRQYEAIG
jgi:hypothetical protein